MSAEPTLRTPERRAARVLHLRDSPWVDGPGRTILETAAHLDPARVEYHIGAFAPDEHSAHPLVAEAQRRGFRVHRIVDAGGIDKRLYSNILRLVDELSIDVLHTSDIRSNVYGCFVKRARPNLRIASTTHGWIANDTRRKVMRWVDKLMLRNFDAVIMVSHAMRRLVPTWWLPDERVTILHNALVLDSYGRQHLDLPRRRIDPAGSVTMLNVGRLSPEKGQDLLLHAFAAIAPRYPQLRLHFAGTGPLQDSLQALAEQLGIADRIRFLGYIHDMPALYREVDLVVQSSLTEGLPNVILEAAYLRVPIIATTVGGTGEVIENDRSGRLLPAGSVGALTDALQDFLADPTRYEAMAQAAHLRILERFSFDARTAALTQIYDRLRA